MIHMPLCSHLSKLRNFTSFMSKFETFWMKQFQKSWYHSTFLKHRHCHYRFHPHHWTVRHHFHCLSHPHRCNPAGCQLVAEVDFPLPPLLFDSPVDHNPNIVICWRRNIWILNVTSLSDSNLIVDSFNMFSQAHFWRRQAREIKVFLCI